MCGAWDASEEIARILQEADDEVGDILPVRSAGDLVVFLPCVPRTSQAGRRDSMLPVPAPVQGRLCDSCKKVSETTMRPWTYSYTIPRIYTCGSL